MGTRGPVPKRSEQRRRRNKESKPDKVAAPITPIDAPPEKRAWHPVAKDWYRSLQESGQAQFYEPSDWQAARLVAEELSQYLRAKKRSAMMFAQLWSAMTDLLTTEGARRRVKIEVERGAPEDNGEDAEIASLDEYRRRVAG